MSTFDHPRRGEELDWLAVDRAGHVGVFSSGGYGPIPRAVVEKLDEVERAVDLLTRLPVIGECAESPVGDGDYSFWVEPGRRGLFGFDWGPVTGGPYARIAVPARPILRQDVSDPLVRETAGLVMLPIDFSRTSGVEAEDLGVDLWVDPAARI